MAWLGLIWLFPLLYVLWAAVDSGEYILHFDPFAPLVFNNLKTAWEQAPFIRYMWNTMAITGLILSGQLIVCTLAANALARLNFGDVMSYLRW